MFPDVESEDGAEAVGDGVVGAGVLADGQGAGVIGLEPNPAGAEHKTKSGTPVGAPDELEGLERTPGRVRFGC